MYGTNLSGRLDVSGSSMNIDMHSTGTLAIDLTCDGEGFGLSGSNVNLNGVSTPGNCVYEALKAN